MQAIFGKIRKIINYYYFKIMKFKHTYNVFFIPISQKKVIDGETKTGGTESSKHTLPSTSHIHLLIYMLECLK